MLEVNQLTRYYDNFKAVDNVSFQIGKGEIVGLLGHNGAGKTTIMKMLSGYLEANQGTIKINQLDLATHLKPIQQQLGYLPENLPIYPEMTVAAYLEYAAELKGLSGDYKIAELKRAIKATELEVKLIDPIANLSRGYKQRVGVAQAILGQPKLLILDEPTNGLDPTQTEHMRQLIKDIAKDATVILSTHIMQEVEALCDRAIIIRNGQLAVDASLEELKQSNQLIVSSSLNLKETQSLLAPIEAIDSVSQQGAASSDTAEILIQLKSDADPQNVSSQIAKLIVNANAQLYTLKQQHIDLETLFKQVNQGQLQNKEVKNAA